MNELLDQTSGVFAFTNNQSASIKIVLEPWGEEVELPAASTLRVAFSGPSGGQVDIKLNDDVLILWGWQGSLLTIVP